MFEQTNQTEMQDQVIGAMDTDEGIFDDYIPENTNEGNNTNEFSSTDGEPSSEGNADGNANGDDQNADTAQQPKNEEKAKIVYNGQEVEMSMDDLKVNAQKGLNYDRIHEKYEGMKNSKVFKVFEKFAKENNMTADEYAETLDTMYENQKVEKLVNDGVPKEVAEKLTRLETKEKEREEKERQADAAKEKQVQFSNFVRKYPNVKASDIPQSVWDEFNKGADLSSAYALHENEILRSELEQYKQNDKNKEKAIGPVQSDNAEQNVDSFLSGLLG